MCAFLLPSEISPQLLSLAICWESSTLDKKLAVLELLWDSLASSSSVLAVCLESVHGGTDPPLLPKS